MTKYLSGSKLYRAYADMLDGGREVQRYICGEWVRATDGNLEQYNHRLKPLEKETVEVYTKYGPKRLPAPLRVALDVGAVYWIASPAGVYNFSWRDSPTDCALLDRGGCLSTQEDAKIWDDFQIKQRWGSHDRSNETVA